MRIKNKIQKGGQYIPTPVLTSFGWHNKGADPLPLATDISAGYNEYIFGRTTPTNDFVVSTGLAGGPPGLQMTMPTGFGGTCGTKMIGGGKESLKKKKMMMEKLRLYEEDKNMHSKEKRLFERKKTEYERKKMKLCEKKIHREIVKMREKREKKMIMEMKKKLMMIEKKKKMMMMMEKKKMMMMEKKKKMIMM